MNLKQTFAQAADDTVKSLGDRLFRLTVFYGAEKIYVSPAAASLLTDSVTRSIGGSVADFFKRNPHGLAMAGKINMGGTTINRMGLNPAPVPAARIVVSEKFPLSMEYMSIFDHELGHLLTPSGLATGQPVQRHESAANAFMAIRHIQRFGTRTDMRDKSMINQSTQLIMYGVTTHYTPAIFDKVASLPNLSSLSMRQTVDLAEDIAARYTLDEAVAKKIYDAFAPLRKSLAASGNVMNNATYKTACDIIRTHKHDGQICRAGFHFIRQFNQPIAPDLFSGIEMNAATAVDKSTPPSSGLKGSLLNIFKKF